MTNTFESCGVSNCFNPSVGFTEVSSIWPGQQKGICMSICLDHKKWIKDGGYMIDNHCYDSYDDYIQKTYRPGELNYAR